MELNITDFVWPLTAIIIALIFFKPINSFIKNIKRFKGPGFEAESDGHKEYRNLVKDTEEGRTNVSNGMNSAPTYAGEGFDPSLVNPLKNSITDILKLNNDSSHEEKLERLLNYSAESELIIKYEQLHSGLRKSEKDVLLYLNTSAGKTASLQVLKERYYDPAAQKNPGLYQNYSFEQFINFLEKQRLIQKSDTDNCKLTIYGRDFLVYSTKQGLI